MKRVAIPLFIVGYLGLSVYGLFCHALSYKTSNHPAMYFIVWDMYCGWAAYETRQHLIGEGESGTYYELAPGPWGSIKLYGDNDRHTHDYHGTFALKMARNTLRQTQHEPMTRVFLVEEAWPRKYNLPDDLWAHRYAEPKDKVSYFQVRCVATPDGQILQQKPLWLTRTANDCLMHNPRLRHDMAGGRQFYAVSPTADRDVVTPTSYEMPVE